MPGFDIQHSGIPAHARKLVQEGCVTFRRQFDREPTVAACAPGRVNLIGEHTDYNFGYVLPFAIERYAVIVADRALEPNSTIVAVDLNERWQTDLSRSLSRSQNSGLNYVLGVADQFQKRGIELPNVDAVMTSSVPIGAGLGSSAAIEVAFAALGCRLAGCDLTVLELARLCQRAEHSFPSTPCGIMDMYVSAAAVSNHALLIDCRSEEARHVPCDFAVGNVELIVMDTGVSHQLSSGGYADRRSECDAAARALGVVSLREATIEMIETHILAMELSKRALHVIAENTRTILAAHALADGDWKSVGDLMFASHGSLRDLFDVSCAELDCLVDAAEHLRQSTGNVLGARMTGGGFGGSAIVLARAGAVDSVVAHLEKSFASRFDRPPRMTFTTIAADGANSMSLGGDSRRECRK